MEHKSNSFRLRWLDLRKKWQSRRMEAIRANSKLDNQINILSMSGRVLPVFAIIGASILYLVDINTYLEIFFMCIALMFLAISITWWWWVMYTIRDIHKNINTSVEQFENIRTEIIKLREDIKKVK